MVTVKRLFTFKIEAKIKLILDYELVSLFWIDAVHLSFPSKLVYLGQDFILIMCRYLIGPERSSSSITMKTLLIPGSRRSIIKINRLRNISPFDVANNLTHEQKADLSVPSNNFFESIEYKTVVGNHGYSARRRNGVFSMSFMSIPSWTWVKFSIVAFIHVCIVFKSYWSCELVSQLSNYSLD